MYLYMHSLYMSFYMGCCICMLIYDCIYSALCNVYVYSV
ncbi:hypothetical protein PP657_gp001 [Bacillus phage BCPST]|uniref:Uncharacterized protein n=1 Tax=Bacillus phage BCPST TaxID=2801506 RepID=A0AAE7PCZ7_9CAUD|nr:hypothetical protein PP657_gp001 [Bacillus phage BCPST]QQO38619.1 hypothetical protein BCPST_001 [Bacillus phage BCPST]QSJ04207.1 hypothetical protein BCP6_002 [Bacillus phage BCP6]